MVVILICEEENLEWQASLHAAPQVGDRIEIDKGSVYRVEGREFSRLLEGLPEVDALESGAMFPLHLSVFLKRE